MFLVSLRVFFTGVSLFLFGDENSDTDDKLVPEVVTIEDSLIFFVSLSDVWFLEVSNMRSIFKEC